VFDQKYPATKEGEIADCRLSAGRLQCAGIHTHTAPTTSIPVVAGPARDSALSGCTPEVRPPLTINGVAIRPEPWSPASDQAGIVLSGWIDGMRQWRSRRQNVLSLQRGLAMTGADSLLFTLERHPSSLDGEDGVRPYVYAVSRQGLVARWRGSALAWPLLDAVVSRDGTLCAAPPRGLVRDLE